MTGQIGKLTDRIEQLLAGLPGSGDDPHDGGQGTAGCDCAEADCAHRQVAQIVRSAAERLDDIPGIGLLAARAALVGAEEGPEVKPQQA
ncbi:hypothetical protein ACWDA3_59365 [Nonomuraea rubra]